MQFFRIQKLANALIPEAAPASSIRGSALFSINLLKNVFGGLWVGGEVLLSQDGIEFIANKRNIEMHTNLQTINLPNENIISIERKPGLFTDIVVVKHTLGEFKFRCYGASDLVDEYKKHTNRL